MRPRYRCVPWLILAVASCAKPEPPKNLAECMARAKTEYFECDNGIGIDCKTGYRADVMLCKEMFDGEDRFGQEVRP